LLEIGEAPGQLDDLCAQAGDLAGLRGDQLQEHRFLCGQRLEGSLIARESVVSRNSRRYAPPPRDGWMGLRDLNSYLEGRVFDPELDKIVPALDM
jgi:hypothetical protein